MAHRTLHRRPSRSGHAQDGHAHDGHAYHHDALQIDGHDALQSHAHDGHAYHHDALQNVWEGRAAAEALAAGAAPRALVVDPLVGNFLDAPDVDALCAGLAQCLSLETVDVAGHGVGDEACARLADALAACRRLRRLDLSDNGAACGAAAAVGRLACSLAAPAAVALDGSSLAAATAAAPLAAAVAAGRLSSLSVARCSLPPAAAARLCAASAAPAACLRRLTLSANRLTGAGPALAAALAPAAALRHLDLAACCLTDADLRALLPAARHLQHLGLSENELTAAVGDVLLAALGDAHAYSFRSLALLNNPIVVEEADGVVQFSPFVDQLASVARSNPALVSLDVGDAARMADDAPLLRLTAQLQSNRLRSAPAQRSSARSLAYLPLGSTAVAWLLCALLFLETAKEHR